jgi:cytoskeletal protein CcmA (bactofilin family)
MHIFTRKTEPVGAARELARPPVVPGSSNRTVMPTQSGAVLSRGVSIKGSVKFLNELLIDGEVEGTIDSTGALTIGEHARIRGEIRTKSVKVRGAAEGNIFVTERCELQAGCTLRGDIEAPRLVISENATFLGSAKIGTAKSSTQIALNNS